MAGIGLYGVFYSKATMTDGVLTAYSGVKTMGKAISASFEPSDGGGSPLYANNGIAERDTAAGVGGTLTLTVDRLSQDAYADLFGLTASVVTVDSVGGSGFDYDGDELANPVGVAFVRWKQEDNSRAHYQAVIYSHVTFAQPSDESQTMGENVEWQTPEIEGTVAGGTVTGAYPWKKVYDFPDQASCIAFITNYFAA